MKFQKGDVILVPMPFTNQRTSKVRPAVVLSSANYHRTEPDVILGALTTNLTVATAPVDYILADWRKANLRFPSAFKPIIFTLLPSLILHRIGTLTIQDLAEIDRRLALIFELTR